MAIRCVLQAAASLRCASRSIDLFFEMEYSQRLAAPSHVTIQNFILRLGLHELLRDKGRADDWIWLVDHTIQLGKTKCLLILGIRHRDWQDLRRPLRHQDLQVLELQPVEQSNGSIVDQQLEHVAQRNGVPLQIVSDEGSDLRKGYDSFLTRHPETLRSGDIAHQVATLLRQQLDKNESWNGFVAAAGICRAKLQQTGVGQWIPPTPKNKGRYMNIDELTGWAQKVLKLLCVARAGRLSESQREDFSVELLQEKLGWVESFATDLQDWTAMAEMGRQTRQLMRTVGYGEQSETKLAAELPPATGPMAITFRAKLLEHVRQESSLVPPGERRLGSTEVLESLFGKGKRLEGQQSRSGFTRYVLGLAASVVELTTDTIREALSTVSIKQLQSWSELYFGDTIQSKRRRDLPHSKQEQKQDKPLGLSIPSF